MQISSKAPIIHVEDFRGFSPVPLSICQYITLTCHPNIRRCHERTEMHGFRTENTEILGATVLSLVAQGHGPWELRNPLYCLMKYRRIKRKRSTHTQILPYGILLHVRSIRSPVFQPPLASYRDSFYKNKHSLTPILIT
jgi:hypothetical protein